MLDLEFTTNLSEEAFKDKEEVDEDNDMGKFRTNTRITKDQYITEFRITRWTLIEGQFGKKYDQLHGTALI